MANIAIGKIDAQNEINNQKTPLYLINEDWQQNIKSPAIFQGAKNMAKLNLKGVSVDSKPRADGRWQARYTDKEGKQHSVYGKTPEDAQRKAIEYMSGKKAAAKRKASAQQKPAVPTLKQWIEQWYKLYKEPFIGESWAKSIKYTLNKYIIPPLGDYKITKITLIELQEVVNDIPHKWMRRLSNQLLKHMFEKAAAVPLIKFNPAAGLVKIQYETDERRPLENEEYKRLCEYLDQNEDWEYAMLIKFYVNTGLRRREALGIEPADIDWDNNCIFIKMQADMTGKRLVPLKTKSSKRYVPIFQDIKSELQKIDLTNKRFLFEFNPQSVTRRFDDIMKTLNIKDIDIHCLRHTFTYQCEQKRIPDETIQRWLGHSKKTTTKIYKHRQENEEIEIIKSYTNMTLTLDFDTKKE